MFGILSQIKIWKIVKERRAKKDEERIRDDQTRDQLESAVGKNIEASNERERAHWEAVYGEKNGPQVHVDSGVGSSIDSFAKRSTSVREREVDGIELADIPRASSKLGSRRGNKHEPRPAVTVRVATDDEHGHLPAQSEENLLDHDYEDITRSASQRSVRIPSHRTSGQSYEPLSDGYDRSQRSSAQAGPSITPLPFSLPVEDGHDDAASERHSVLSKGTVDDSVNVRRGVSLKHLSLDKDRNNYGFLIPHIEDDRASSVAATADDDLDGDLDALSAPRLSAAPSPYQLEFPKDGLSPMSGGVRERSRSPSGRAAGEAPVEENDDEELIRPETATGEYATQEHGRNRSSVQSKRRSVRSAAQDEPEDEEADVSVVGSLRDHLPARMSKVAMTYRTNEWAKHIADADMPEVEEASESHSPGIKVDTGFAEEAARPVDIEALQESVPASAAGDVSRNASVASKNPYRQNSKSRPYNQSRASSGGAATPVYAYSRSASAMSVQRTGSGATTPAQPRLATQGLRNASAPLANQPLVESPIEDALAASGPYRNASSPMGMASTNNLMDVRNDRMKRKPTATSFPALGSTPNFHVIAPSDSASLRGAQLDEADADNISLAERKNLIDEENMTLAERKALVQQREQSGSRQGTWPLPTRMNSVNNQNLIYDSHQPRRSNTVDTTKQNTMLSNWRQSLQTDTAAKQPLMMQESAQQAMLHERRQKEWYQARELAERTNRESVMDQAMRTGALNGAHRDALRRMQAKANNQT